MADAALMTPDPGAISASRLLRLPPTAALSFSEARQFGARRVDFLLRHAAFERFQPFELLLGERVLRRELRELRALVAELDGVGDRLDVGEHFAFAHFLTQRRKPRGPGSMRPD